MGRLSSRLFVCLTHLGHQRGRFRGQIWTFLDRAEVNDHRSRRFESEQSEGLMWKCEILRVSYVVTSGLAITCDVVPILRFPKIPCC